MTEFYLSRLHFPVTTLGPGRRIGIWFQGCSIRCPGCISADTWAQGKHVTTVDAVFDCLATWLPFADGVTISGGEPFDQPEALVYLLRRLRQAFKGDILVYSGHPKKLIEPVLEQARDLIDALISDPFQLETINQLPLRGSDNQQLHQLTPLGLERYADFKQPRSEAPALDVMFDDDGTVWFAGIPRRGDLRLLQDVLEAAGNKVATSEDHSIVGKGGVAC